MFQMICAWLYENSMAIFISAIASLVISKRYYDKGNREAVLTSIIFPMVQLLEKRYSKGNYEKLFEIKLSYAIRYLHKAERNKMLILIDNYREVCRYSKDAADTDCIMSYYSYKLKQNGINPKPCPIRDDDGNIVADDYPPDYNYLQDEIYAIVTSFEFVELPQDCTDKMIKAFKRYTKEYYTDKEISFFDDYSVEKVIAQSDVTKKWRERFEAVNRSKEDFLALPICKKAIKILNESKGGCVYQSQKSKSDNKEDLSKKMLKNMNALKDAEYSSIYVVVCFFEQTIVLELLSDAIHSKLLYFWISLLTLIVMFIICDKLIKGAKKKIEAQKDFPKSESNKFIECATMLGYLSPVLCLSTWIGGLAEADTFVIKWFINILVLILGIGVPLLVKKKNN